MTEKQNKLNTIRKRFGFAESSMMDNRKECLEDIKFKKGDQWPESVRGQRGKDTVELTINRTQAMVKQVVNDQRQNRPSIKTRPVDSGADKQTASVIEGLIRNIEQQSGAESVYDWGYEQAVDGGYGYWRLTTEFADEDSFDQDIRIRRIRNRFDVLFDPKAEDALKEDGRYAFVHKKRDKAELQKKYKKASFTGFDGVADQDYIGWWDEETARVCEYFYKEKKQKRIALLNDGNVITVPERLDNEDIDPDEWIAVYTQENSVEIVKQRLSTYDQVKWCLCTATDILKEQDWAGRFIPIVPIIGDEIDIEGKVYYAGLVRYLRDPQRMYNYWISKATQKVALSPMSKLLVTNEQLAGNEAHWNAINTDPKPYIPYNHVNGQTKPDEFKPAQLDSGMANLIMMASDHMKETSGIYDASLGARSNETSGIAISQRKEQGNIANFHFTDNLSKSIAYTGKILVDLIPRIYDAKRTVRILGEDGTTQNVMLNEQYQDENTGEDVLYDLKAGRYDVVVEAGPGYSTKRAEAFDYMLQLVQSSPNLMGVIGDLMFKNADLPNADEISERLAGAMGQAPDASPTQGQPGMPQ